MMDTLMRISIKIVFEKLDGSTDIGSLHVDNRDSTPVQIA